MREGGLVGCDSCVFNIDIKGEVHVHWGYFVSSSWECMPEEGCV